MEIKLSVDGDLSTPNGRAAATFVCAAAIARSAGADPEDATVSLLAAAAYVMFVSGVDDPAGVHDDIVKLLHRAVSIAQGISADEVVH